MLCTAADNAFHLVYARQWAFYFYFQALISLPKLERAALGITADVVFK